LSDDLGSHPKIRTALITGIAGQDGACLADLLLGKGYKVVGSYLPSGHASLWRLEETGLLNHPNLSLVPLDLLHADQCLSVVGSVFPDEVYNLGGPSFIGQSFADPLKTARTTGLGALSLLEAIRVNCPNARFFQASSSEMFGNATVSPQHEGTPFNPRSPYAAAKLFAHWATVTYRESYGVFASSGILYNHESPLRGLDFVTRKITHGAASIYRGMQDVIELGNLDAMRDWGYAPEYAEGMWQMLQAGEPDTFVLSTGKLTRVRTFVEAAFRATGVDISWHGHGVEEIGRDTVTGQLRIKSSPHFFRPAEPHPLCGDPSKAERMLRWKAETKVDDVCSIMVEADIKRLSMGAVT
jgi:GDPmannose 4,6-dehydratase